MLLERRCCFEQFLEDTSPCCLPRSNAEPARVPKRSNGLVGLACSSQQSSKQSPRPRAPFVSHGRVAKDHDGAPQVAPIAETSRPSDGDLDVRRRRRGQRGRQRSMR
jgi:hypothetical protein